MAYQNLSIKNQRILFVFFFFCWEVYRVWFRIHVGSEQELAYYATFSNFYKTCPSTLCFVQYYLSSYIAMSFLEKTTSFKRFVVHTCIMYGWDWSNGFYPLCFSIFTKYNLVIVHQNVVLGYVLIYQNLSLIFVHEEPNTWKLVHEWFVVDYTFL